MSQREQAVKIFEDFNCSQSVCAAFAKQFGLECELALKVSAGFGGGMGRMAHTCGAVSGAFMVLGLKYGSAEPNDKVSKENTYAKVRAFAEKFTERQGSVLCRDLLECDISTPEGYAHAKEHDLFTEQCPVFIRAAAEILEEMLHEEG